jgi:hypothetical protein
MADNSWLVIAFLFAIFLFHSAVFSIPSLSIAVIFGPSARGSSILGFLWFVERLFVLPLATISFMEERSSDIVQEDHSRE